MSNGRNAIIRAVLKHIERPSFEVRLPWLLQRTWDSALSPVAEIREGYRIQGRLALHYAFMLAFRQVCHEFDAGCATGLYGVDCDLLAAVFVSSHVAFQTVEDALLSEAVLFELLKKPFHPNVVPIASKGVRVVADGVYIFFGALWSETEDPGKVSPCVDAIFLPLILTALATLNTA
jgi:hypothetical protein